MSKASHVGTMIMRAGVCRDAETSQFRILLHQWLNTTEKDPPAVRMFLPESFDSEAKAEHHLAKVVLPDLRKKLKLMRRDLPMLKFRSGRLKPEHVSSTEQAHER
jgi:hypothetical protein